MLLLNEPAWAPGTTVTTTVWVEVTRVEIVDVCAGSVVRTVEVEVRVTVTVPVVMLMVEVVQSTEVVVMVDEGTEVEVSVKD